MTGNIYILFTINYLKLFLQVDKDDKIPELNNVDLNQYRKSDAETWRIST